MAKSYQQMSIRQSHNYLCQKRTSKKELQKNKVNIRRLVLLSFSRTDIETAYINRGTTGNIGIASHPILFSLVSI